MNSLQAFEEQCRLWNDGYLLEEFSRGEAAYADKAYFAVLQQEVARRGLPLEPAADAGPLPSGEAAPPPGGSLIGRLWRGEVSLGETYWIWGILVNLLIRFGASDLHEVAPVLGVVPLAYQVFILVAIWRSATRYRGPQLWGMLAKIVVVFNVLIFVVVVVDLLRW